MKIRYFLLCLLVLASLLPTGCADASARSYFSYAAAPFRAEIRGSLNGIDFAAEIGRDTPQSPDLPMAGAWIRYTAPSVMSGLTLRYDDNECPILSVGELDRAWEREELRGLLLPTALLLAYAEPKGVRKENGATVLTTSDYVLTLSEDGIPISAVSASASIEVVWWETAKTP